MLESLASHVKKTGANVMRVGALVNGSYHESTLLPAAPCQNIYSVTKSVTSLAVGMAWDAGLLRLEEPILSYLGPAPGEADPKLADVTVEHLLWQVSGIDKGSLFEADRWGQPDRDWTHHSLTRPMPHRPGTHFTYDNGNFYLLGRIVARVAGMPLTYFLRERLFAPLDICEFATEQCPQGHALGATGLYMRLEDLVKLGRLVLDGGTVQGRQLLSRAYIDRALSPGPAENQRSYGYGIWLGETGVSAAFTGAYNQLVYVSFPHNAVVGLQGFDSTLKTQKLASHWLDGVLEDSAAYLN